MTQREVTRLTGLAALLLALPAFRPRNWRGRSDGRIDSADISMRRSWVVDPRLARGTPANPDRTFPDDRLQMKRYIKRQKEV